MKELSAVQNETPGVYAVGASAQSKLCALFPVGLSVRYLNTTIGRGKT